MTVPDSGRLVHWDDVDPVDIDEGDWKVRRRRLGAAAGAQAVGASRWDVAPGARQAPLHLHADEEEIVFVLRGSGLLVEGKRCYELGEGDVCVHRAGGSPHTRLAGDDGLDVLIFASGSAAGLTWLPRPNVMWAPPRWVPIDGPNPFAAEVAAGPIEPGEPLPGRPAHVVRLADSEPEVVDRPRTKVKRRFPGDDAGAQRSGLTHIEVQPGAESHPVHCHSAEEEVFVVLAGSGTLLLGDTEHAVRPGHVLGRPAGTGISHGWTAGPDGLELLAYGQRDPNDICFYPRSGKLAIRGIGVVGRIERAGYWDGED